MTKNWILRTTCAAATVALAAPAAEAQSMPCGLSMQSAPTSSAPAAKASTNSWTDPANALTWVFEPSVPPADQQLIVDLLTAVEPTLRTLIGPPTRSQAVRVEFGTIPPQFAAAYYPSANRIRLGWVPSQGGDPAAFKENFVHEVVHAYQDAALDVPSAWADWVIEGIAVAATGLVRLVHPDELDAASPWRPRVVTSRYDSLAFIGPDRLSGTRRFANAFSLIDAYVAAGGFWLLLTGAQETGPVGDILQYDFLSRFLAIHYGAQRPLDSASAQLSLQQALLGTIDGEPAFDWATRQPILETQGAAGAYIWAGLASGGGYRYGAFTRTSPGGGAFPVTSGTMVDRVYDTQGNLLREQGGTLMIPIRGGSLHTPGAYTVEIDGSAIGFGTLRIPVVTTADLDEGIEGGVGLGFEHPALSRVVDVAVSPLDGATVLEDNGADLFTLPDPLSMPATLRFDFGTGPRTISVPAPLRRLVPITLPVGFEPDRDGDGVVDRFDNCVAATNPAQVDYDGDGDGDLCDVCPADPANDVDADGLCAVLRADLDADGCVTSDDLPLVSAAYSAGDAAADLNGDGVVNLLDVVAFANARGDCQDNCPDTANPGQADYDADLVGTACDVCPADPNDDDDGNGICAWILGDVDGSGCVDAADLQLLIAAVGSSDPVLDIDGDGLVTNADVTLAAQAFGQCGDGA